MESQLMESQLEKKPIYTGYRWVILILMSLAQIAGLGSNMQLSAMGEVLIATYGLTAASFGAIANASFLGGLIFGIPTGAWADRFGIRKVLSVFFVIGFAGTVLRMFATTSVTLFIAMFLLGLTAGTGAANSSKIFAVWFPQNQMTVAFSIYGGMATVGAIGAMASTPLLLQAGVSISSIFSIGTVAMGICMVGWLVFGRSKPANAPELKTESVMQYMGTVVKNKHLWLENGAMFFFMGSTMACSTFVIPCLTIVKGATFPQAAFWSSMSAVFSMIGTVVLPGLLGKSGYLKRTYIIAAIVAAVIIAIAWALPFSTGSMVLFMIGILIMGCGIPIHKQYPALLKSIPVVAIGSAGGLQSVIQSLGGFLVPSFILGAIATATNNYSAVIFGVAVLMVVSAIFTLGLPEIGAKGNQRKLGDLEAASAEGRS